MTTLPNTGTVLPVRGAPGSGLWGDSVDDALRNYDEHDHSSGKGKRINTDAISIDADLTFASLYAPTNLHRATFAAITALAAGARAIFVDTSGDLYYRNSAGVNIRVTNGSNLNVAAFIGGIGGDYTSVAAALNYDNANLRYTLRQGGGTTWARIASGEVRIYETSSTDTVYVGLAAPAALAASYAITLPLALPSATSFVKMSSAGVLSTEEVPGHGDLVLALPGVAAKSVSNASYDTAGNSLEVLSTGATTLWWSIPLHVGDRIKSLVFSCAGDGTADITSADVRLYNSATATASSLGSTTVTNPGATPADVAISVTDTVLADGESISFRVAINAALLAIYNVRVTYDRP